ncbi:MAG: hypothetical protein RL719_596 [Actinomycetota bacterium]
MDEFVSKNEGRIDWDELLDELRSVGFTNPLLNFEPSTYSQIDLERAHPGGIAQLVSGGSAVLSNLFRDPLAFSRAYSAAKRIKDHSEILDSQFGIRGLGLVGGLLNLEQAGFDLSLPILIWPVSLERKTDDFELKVLGGARVNPGLIAALEVSFGVRLDAAELVGLTRQTTDLVPMSVLAKISEAVGQGSKLETKRILALGNFSSETIELVESIQRTDSPLLKALYSANKLAADSSDDDQQEPAADLNDVFLVADADSTQRRVVARAVAGDSFAVETLPGCGYTQTMVNTIAALQQAGKKVLVLAPRRQTLNELADRFASLGLAGIAVRAHSTWLDVISAISRHEKAQPVALDVAKIRLAAATGDAQHYFDLLVSEDNKLGVTLTAALEQLAKLSLMPKPPQTSARIASGDLVTHKNRTDALQLLMQAADLAEFDFSPSDSAWFQARFETEEQVARAVALAKRLSEDAFENLRNQMDGFISKSGFKPAQTCDDWGLYLQLFMGVRETLGRFVPEVFARPLDELIIATGPRNGSQEMSGGNRRRLKKLAKEYLRPGMHVADIHEALQAASWQREEWKKLSLTESNPDVPSGINDVMVAYQAFVADLNALQVHLDNDESAKPLAKLNLDDLAAALNSMATDTAPLQQLEARNEVRAALKAAGLAPLARNLAQLKVSREQLSLELDLAWWQSALEYLIARDASVMNYTPEQIRTIESSFVRAGDEVITLGAAELTHQTSQRWHSAVSSQTAQTQALKSVLQSRSASLRSIFEAAPAFCESVFTAVMASPYELASVLSTGHNFDVVIVADAAGTTVAENLAGLVRAQQLIAFGDEAIAAPDGFEFETTDAAAPETASATSIFSSVREAFGAETLRKSWRPNGQTLGAFVNREFYQNRIQFLATPGDLNGKSNLSIEILRSGIGVTPASTSNESPDAEVDRVVSMVLSHVEKKPEDSLLVVTASTAHAKRIDAALLQARKSKPESNEWFKAHGREKFEVTTLRNLSHRVADRIIFSIGFSTDQSNQAPRNLGDLNLDAGARYFANMLVSARNELDVVSCFSADQISADSLQQTHQMLREVLASNSVRETYSSESDPLLEDLALRLKKLGAHVVENLGDGLPLVASYANNSAVICPDWNLYGDDLNEKLRLLPALLGAMGWQVVRVHSFELFSDPEALAIRIGEGLGMQLTKRPQVLFDSPSFDETDAAWGDRSDSNDQRLKSDKPPHWG